MTGWVRRQTAYIATALRPARYEVGDDIALCATVPELREVIGPPASRGSRRAQSANKPRRNWPVTPRRYSRPTVTPDGASSLEGPDDRISGPERDQQDLSGTKRITVSTDRATASVWPRASALMARQSLEAALDEFWQTRAPADARDCARTSTHAQLLCLRRYLDDGDLAGRVAWAWSGLSRACHHHAYDMPPSASELEAWVGVVEEFAAHR